MNEGVWSRNCPGLQVLLLDFSGFRYSFKKLKIGVTDSTVQVFLLLGAGAAANMSVGKARWWL